MSSPNTLWKHLESSEWQEALSLLSSDENAVDMSKYVHRNKLPLHYCIKKKAPEEVILSLIEHYEIAVTRKGGQCDMLPLHYAIASSASHNVIKSLVAVYPDALDAKDKNNKTPRDYVNSKLAMPSKRIVMASTSEYEEKIVSLSLKALNISAKLKGNVKEIEEKVNNTSRILDKSQVDGIKETELRVIATRESFQKIVKDIETTCEFLRVELKTLQVEMIEEVDYGDEEEKEATESTWFAWNRQ